MLLFSCNTTNIYFVYILYVVIFVEDVIPISMYMYMLTFESRYLFSIGLDTSDKKWVGLL